MRIPAVTAYRPSRYVAPPVATAVSSPAPATPSATRIRLLGRPALELVDGLADQPRRGHEAPGAGEHQERAGDEVPAHPDHPEHAPQVRGEHDPYGTPHRGQAIVIALQAVDGAGVVAQDHPRGALGGRVGEQLGQDRGERVAPPGRGEEVQLRRAGGVGGVQQLRDRRELERLGQRRRRAARRAGSSARGRRRRWRRRARASPPRARTGSSAAARRASCGSARSAA